MQVQPTPIDPVLRALGAQRAPATVRDQMQTPNPPSGSISVPAFGKPTPVQAPNATATVQESSSVIGSHGVQTVTLPDSTISVPATARSGDLPANEVAQVVNEIRREIRDEAKLSHLVDKMADKVVDQLMKSRDVNEDQLLTAEELGLEQAKFSEIDADRDGFVTPTELRASLAKQMQVAGQTDPVVNPKTFADQWMAALDLNKDQTVTPVIEAVPQPIIAELDRDGDGAASKEEVRATVRERVSNIDTRSHLEQVAARISDKLEERGFSTKPPTNLQSIVQSFGFDAASSQFLMSVLSARYPQGLGISLFG